MSYLAQTYFFKTRELLLTVLLGGLYSSTATSVVISRRARLMNNDRRNDSSALITDNDMMYLGLLVIIFILDNSAGRILLVPFSVVMVVSCLVVMRLLRLDNNGVVIQSTNTSEDPLELSTAILFAFMFVIFYLLPNMLSKMLVIMGLIFYPSWLVLQILHRLYYRCYRGSSQLLMTPLFPQLSSPVGSNNLLKAAYAAILDRNRFIMAAIMWLLLLFVISLCYAFLFV